MPDLDILNTQEKNEIIKENPVHRVLSDIRANYILHKVMNSHNIKRPDTTHIMEMLKSKRNLLNLLIKDFHSQCRTHEEYRVFALKVLEISDASYKEPSFWEVRIINFNEIIRIFEYLEHWNLLTSKQMRESVCKIIYILENLD